MAKPNIKALAIDHGEKIVFGLFAVIVLGVLASTSWARYARTPDELKKNIANAESKISDPSNFWPKAEEESYKVVDFSEKSQILFTPYTSIAMGRFDFSTPLYHPLYRKDEPKREPTYEPVAYLMTRTGLAPLSMTSKEAQANQPMDDSTSAPEEKKMPMEPTGEFDERPTTGGGVGAAKPANTPMTAAAAHKPAAHNPANGMFKGMPGSSAMESSMASQGSDVEALGVRYIAVRGVFPLRKQIENYKRALHLSESEAAALVEITDFVLERQVAKAGPDPWKDSEWKTVSLDKAKEILEECSDLDPYDPVPTAMKDPVITMNLPLRLLFVWGESATHPKIKDDELKREEMEMEDKMIETLDETLGQSNMSDVPKPRRKGLANVQRDVKGLVTAAKSNPDMMQMMKEMSKKVGSASGPTPPTGPASGHMGAHMGPGGARPMAPGPMNMGGPGALRGSNSIDRLVVNARYLLFRYLDFDVESGMAYRYRVRLTLRNPNFELSPEELGSGDIEITKGEERETPWSNISNPEVVPAISNYYLAQVAREPYHEDKVKQILSKPVAQLTLFDWSTKLGTTITDLLNIPALGSFIGEEKKEPLVLNLAEGVLDKEKNHKFSTLNVLVDVESDVEVAISEHPDLKLPASKNGKTKLNLLPEALVAMESGELDALDPFSEDAEEQNWLRRIEAERKGFEVGGVSKKTGSRLDDLVNKDSSDKPGKKKKKKKRNPRRGTAQASAMATPAAAHGGATPPSTNGTSKKKK